MVADFRREVDEKVAPLGYNAPISGNFLPAIRDNISAPSWFSTPSDGSNELYRNVGRKLQLHASQ